MMEGTPGGPYGSTLNDLLTVEDNMRDRRRIAQTYLGPNEIMISMTNFPMLGVPGYFSPSHDATPEGGASKSLFIPDEAINPHPRFRTLTANIRQRRGSKVVINVPIYKDTKTPSPFLEPSPASLKNPSIDLPAYIRESNSSSLKAPLRNGAVIPEEASNLDRNNLPPLPFVIPDAKPDHIYLDCMCFGMGCSCLQVTFQACAVEEARRLYDQLAVMAPIMMALSAGSPIYRGYLADIDCRWSVISGSVDDRTKEERGEEPLKENKFRIPKSRYDSISTYLSAGPNYSGGCGTGVYSDNPDQPSPTGSVLAAILAKGNFFRDSYNDLPLVYDEEIYNTLLRNGVDDLLAKHYAHLFIRDPLVIYKELLELDNEKSSDHFENIQSTNWQTMRFKPPPPNASFGWRVEFRSMEIQMTDRENAAFAIFVVLLTRTILSFDLNFYIPLSKVDANMQAGQKRDAVLTEKFYFRKSVFGNPGFRPSSIPNGQVAGENTDEFTMMTIDEIINGKEGVCHGIISLIKSYLDSTPISIETSTTLHSYLDIISKKASGALPTSARWVRNFVTSHPDYQNDSKVSDRINWDLLKKVDEIGRSEDPVVGLNI
ncbi:hypothetical protein HDU76_008543 [Blyttiomyces sp. JEL0837]|nr:hypothetical protein HDU76_008543 [Blyttiomyces sp. JEL0837]